jgi:predicted transcriptional regulator
MARPTSRHPTELELDILKILWDRGPLPTSGIREALAEGDPPRDLAHTSVITILNIMVKKKYLRRTKPGAAYLFHARVERPEVAGSMLEDLLNRVFDGSASAMMLNLLERTDLDEEEIKDLRRMIRRRGRGS